jgi:hypothetical protein
MLGLGAGSPWAMLWAKAATHHGRVIFLANGAQRLKNVSYVGRYAGLVLNRRKKLISFKIPHKPPAGSLKVLHAPARRGGIRRAPQTKIYNLETRE